ncbi:hypothetical protein BC831DRAFT_510065 [Entophlyctis helioformis]|nr:hypothetical protein BC831DRAFT_510065 [Entophlyctis helioformis]
MSSSDSNDAEMDLSTPPPQPLAELLAELRADDAKDATDSGNGNGDDDDDEPGQDYYDASVVAGIEWKEQPSPWDVIMAESAPGSKPGESLTERLRALKAQQTLAATTATTTTTTAAEADASHPTGDDAHGDAAELDVADQADFIGLSAFVDDDDNNRDSNGRTTAAADDRRASRGGDRRTSGGAMNRLGGMGSATGYGDRQFLSIGPLTMLPTPPWVPEDRTYSRDMLTRLDEEIDDYVDYVKPTAAEHSMRKLVVERIRRAVEAIWPDATVEVFGSFETMLYLPSSDVDVVVMCDKCHPPNCLYQLRKSLETMKVFSSIEVISKAKVPIIKGIDALTNFAVDISFNMTNGVQSAALVKQFVEDPKFGEGIRPMMLILKQFLTQRHLHEVFTGGLGSYGLLILVASFLRMHPLIQTGEMRPRDNLGVLLIEFFELYGKYFSFQHLGIGLSTDGVYYFEKYASSVGSFGRPSPLSLIDPNDSSNDVGRGSYNFHLVRQEFGRAYNLLQTIMGKGYERQQQRWARERRRDHRDYLYTRRDIRDADDAADDADDELYACGGRNMVTVLGSILSVKREVLEHRDAVERLYEDMAVDHPVMWALLRKLERRGLRAGEAKHISSTRGGGGGGSSGAASGGGAAAGKKRKRGRQDVPESEVIYVPGSSDDEGANGNGNGNGGGSSSHGNRKAKRGSHDNNDDDDEDERGMSRAAVQQAGTRKAGHQNQNQSQNQGKSTGRGQHGRRDAGNGDTEAISDNDDTGSLDSEMIAFRSAQLAGGGRAGSRDQRREDGLVYDGRDIYVVSSDEDENEEDDDDDDDEDGDEEEEEEEEEEGLVETANLTHKERRRIKRAKLQPPTPHKHSGGSHGRGRGGGGSSRGSRGSRGSSRGSGGGRGGRGGFQTPQYQAKQAVHGGGGGSGHTSSNWRSRQGDGGAAEYSASRRGGGSGGSSSRGRGSGSGGYNGGRGGRGNYNGNYNPR